MKGWQSLPLEDCIEPVVYKTRVQRKDFLVDGDYPVVSQEEAFINGFWNQEADLFKVDRPVVVFGDHTRVLKFVDFDFVLGADGVKVLKPRPFLDPRFFYYELHTARLDSLGYARHYRLLREHHVAYPHLPEQRRIVAILDEAFEAIATAKANTEKNLQNAREAFTSALASTFPGGGDSNSLADLSLSISDGDHAPPPKAASGVPFITISNIDKETRKIDFTDAFAVPREYFEGLKSQRRPQPGDVLYTVTGSFGIPVLVEDEREFCFQRHIGLIRPRPDVNGRWLTYALLSPAAFAQADAGATGTAQRTVSLGTLRALRLPKVPSDAQCRDAERLDALDAEVDRLKRTSRAKLAALDELKKSLLQQAFTGQLTAKSADRQLATAA
ncbi:restriction endonuclease subunit S [Piscinibacterium candidicorallinum]|uniref:Restriction endonuclease subunit S n=1 Tax=Piscinibacterium candidicorallinum TaxID=1793872 RepID=A0ABV7H5L3_9BURK